MLKIYHSVDCAGSHDFEIHMLICRRATYGQYLQYVQDLHVERMGLAAERNFRLYSAPRKLFVLHLTNVHM